LGNWAGTVIMAGLAYTGNLFAEDPWKSFVITFAANKIEDSWSNNFIKSIPANMLVCLALYMGIAADDVVSKILGIWIPTMAFVVIGLDHSIANMFFVTSGVFYDDSLSYGKFCWNNLLPVTLGNIVGGSLLIGINYWYLYGMRKNTKPNEFV